MVKKCAYFKGFTLAEVMIVLTVIGVLTAILLPVARQSMPDENLMKFKKAHNTLGTVIRELVTSDKYYLDGDLGVRPDGTLIDGSHEGDITYLCETFADVLNVKAKNCSNVDANISGGSLLSEGHYVDVEKQWLDTVCLLALKPINSEIIIDGNITFFQSAPIETFGIDRYGVNLNYCSTLTDTPLPDYCINTDWGHNERNYGSILDSNGMQATYKAFCIDIDGIPPNASADDCVNECPFGYGIRADGKILTGKRADEWLARGVNEE